MQCKGLKNTDGDCIINADCNFNNQWIWVLCMYVCKYYYNRLLDVK